MGDLSAHFDQSEFACKDGCGATSVSPKLVDKVEAIRLWLMRPVTINSGCRCHKRNEEEGGKPDSAHITDLEAGEVCEAADLAATTSRQRWEIVQGAIVAGITRIGIGKTFVHVDVDRTKDQDVIWLY